MHANTGGHVIIYSWNICKSADAWPQLAESDGDVALVQEAMAHPGARPGPLARGAPRWPGSPMEVRCTSDLACRSPMPE